jgi:hypothetical protein
MGFHMDSLNRFAPRAARSRAQRGLAVVEMVFVLPILVLVLFGMADFSLVLHDYLAASNAARVAVRSATLSAIPCVPGTQEQRGRDAANALLTQNAVQGVAGVDIVHVGLNNDQLCTAGLIGAEIRVDRPLTFLSGFAPLLFSDVNFVATATALNENGN